MGRMRRHGASLVEVLGLGLVVAFAASWGLRWALLAAGAALVVVGLALGGTEAPAPPREDTDEWIS